MPSSSVLLTTADVARRLGVKPATVYAYVSRGLLTSRRNADGKGSLFAKPDVDAFIAGRRRTTTPGIQTGITLIRDGALYYRGHDACELAGTVHFETVAELLWTGVMPPEPPHAEIDPPSATATRTPSRGNQPAVAVRATERASQPAAERRFQVGAGSAFQPEIEAASRPGAETASRPGAETASRPGGATASRPGAETASRPGAETAFRPGAETAFRPEAAVLRVAVGAVDALPRTARLTDRLRVIVAAAAAVDPMRFDTSAAAVVGTGRALLATMVVALPYGVLPVEQSVRERAGESSIARTLWHRLSSRAPDVRDIETLNAALVLLADHDIAASTLAARVAASTRAHPYAVVGAGLAALDGPLHGAASGVAYAMLAEALDRDDPMTSVAERMRGGGPVPGFGHPLYPDGDPRAVTLLNLLDDGPVRECATQLTDAMRTRSGSYPNVDFALAALTLQNDMPADAGEAVFAVARTAGWLAHALEEYADRPLRFRPNGLYAGRPPTSDA